MLYPLRFEPILRRYLWGGRRLATHLNKQLGPGDDFAESWEIVDRGDDQSRVLAGKLAGTTLKELVHQMSVELLGVHAPQPRFPLLFKFLDCRQKLSVQVHPNDAQAARLDPPDLGKTEAWVVLDAEPNSEIYAGLAPGCTREKLAAAIEAGQCHECLHRLQPRAGDCLFIPAGTVHALGGGLLIAEIQQASDTTFRLFDWNRVDADGRPRSLHVRKALDAIDYQRGPVPLQSPQPAEDDQTERLVTCEQFVLDRLRFDAPRAIGGDNRFHLLAVLDGSLEIAGDPLQTPLRRGDTALLPAVLPPTMLTPRGASVVLDIYLP